LGAGQDGKPWSAVCAALIGCSHLTHLPHRLAYFSSVQRSARFGHFNHSVLNLPDLVRMDSVFFRRGFAGMISIALNCLDVITRPSAMLISNNSALSVKSRNELSLTIGIEYLACKIFRTCCHFSVSMSPPTMWANNAFLLSDVSAASITTFTVMLFLLLWVMGCWCFYNNFYIKTLNIRILNNV